MYEYKKINITYSWLVTFIVSIVMLSNGTALADKTNQNKEPTALVTQDKIFIKEVVTGEAPALEQFDVNVSGIRGANHYQYKFGTIASTYCGVEAGYSALMFIDQNFNLDISAILDRQDVVLCLIGAKVKKGVVVATQPLPNATSYQWFKDKHAPVYPVARLQNKQLLRNINDGESSLIRIRSKIKGSNHPSHYRSKFGLTASTDCSLEIGYSVEYTPTREWLDIDISGVPDGDVSLCLLAAKIRNGDVLAEQPYSDPTTYTWAKSTGQGDTTPPEAFSILSPSNTIVSQTPIITWEAAVGADLYDLIISETADCSVEIQGFQNIIGSSFQLVSPLLDGDYFTCVTAKDLSGNTALASNNGFAFSVDATAPSAFNILSPIGVVTESAPLVTWEVSVGAASYDVVVSTDVLCAVSTQEASDLSVESFALAPLSDGVYHVCVTARDDVNNVTDATNNSIMFSIETIPLAKHIVFATASTLGISPDPDFPPEPGFFGSLAAADWQCTLNAFQGGRIPGWNGIDVVYSALLSSSTIDVRDRISVSGEIFNTNDDLVAVDGDDLWDASLDNAVDYNEFGNQIIGSFTTWTGSSSNGTAGPDGCDDWSNPSATAITGSLQLTGGAWLADAETSCGGTARIYCISPAIPVQ